jgi:hypothetical protein
MDHRAHGRKYNPVRCNNPVPSPAAWLADGLQTLQAAIQAAVHGLYTTRWQTGGMCVVFPGPHPVKRLPPHGKALAERLRFGNPPLHAVVCVGLNAWPRAKKWNQSPADTVAMVAPADTPPASLAWPVEHIPVVIDADTGPSEQQISDLALALLQSGSLPVTCISRTKSHPFRQFRWSPEQ